MINDDVFSRRGATCKVLLCTTRKSGFFFLTLGAGGPVPLQGADDALQLARTFSRPVQLLQIQVICQKAFLQDF